MGDTGISGVEAVGPAGEEAAHVVHAARPEGGPAPAGGRLRACSGPAGRDRLPPPLQARSRQGVQPRRPRPAAGFSQTPRPCPARGEAKREKGRTAPCSLTPERGKPRPSDGAARFPGRRSSGFRRRRAGTALRRLPRGPPGTVVFPRADRGAPPDFTSRRAPRIAAAPGRAGPAAKRGHPTVRQRCGVGADKAPLRGSGRSRRCAGLGESRRQRPPAGTAQPPAHRELCPGRAPSPSCAEGCGRSACGTCKWKRFAPCFLN